MAKMTKEKPIIGKLLKDIAASAKKSNAPAEVSKTPAKNQKILARSPALCARAIENHYEHSRAYAIFLRGIATDTDNYRLISNRIAGNRAAYSDEMRLSRSHHMEPDYRRSRLIVGPFSFSFVCPQYSLPYLLSILIFHWNS